MPLRRFAAVATVAGAVLAIAIPVTLAARQRDAAPTAAETATFSELPSPAATPDLVKGMPNPTGCPVDAPELLEALQSSGISQHLPATRRLTDVDCYETWALARTETATVIFRYTETTDSWQAISGGTSESCAKLPEKVRTHLNGCD